MNTEGPRRPPLDQCAIEALALKIMDALSTMKAPRRRQGVLCPVMHRNCQAADAALLQPVDLDRSPRFAAKAAPAAICCFFDFDFAFAIAVAPIDAVALRNEAYSQEAEDQQQSEAGDKDEEQHLGDLGCACGNASEAQQTRDDGDNQEYDRGFKHSICSGIALRLPNRRRTEWLRGAISQSETFATGSGIREIARLRRLYGRGRWRKRKGIARVRLADGSTHMAEVHWYEAAGIGRKELKIKHLL
jgi:hypothetical protein